MLRKEQPRLFYQVFSSRVDSSSRDMDFKIGIFQVSKFFATTTTCKENVEVGGEKLKTFGETVTSVAQSRHEKGRKI
jgi:hypothetical protein